MAYKQKDDDILFPTTQGPHIGRAAIRTLIDNTGYEGDGLHKRYRYEETIEGKSNTRMSTRNGHPEVVTERTPQELGGEACPASDYGFVNSNYNVNYNYVGERLDLPLYTLFDENGAVKKAKHARNSITRKDSLMWKAAPLFTGAMRRVVQIENGKKSGPPPAGEGEVPFSPTWSSTDGLYVGMKASGMETTRYVVRINSSGVWRIPLRFCKDLPVDWKAQEATWRATLDSDKFHAKVSPYWTVKTFDESKAVKISDAPSCYTDGTNGYAPFYGWCGWAFNYDGTAATVVCTGFESMDAPYQTNRMYDLTISHFDGVPISATCVISEHGPFVNAVNDSNPGGHNAALQSPIILPGYLATYPFYNPTNGIPNQNTPVYSYYESTGAKIVVRFKYINGTTITTSHTTTFQTPEISYLTPFGTFASTGFDPGLGYAVTTPIDVSPEPGFITYSPGPVWESMTGGTYGTVGPCSYSTHISEVGESHTTPLKIMFSLEVAGGGYTQDSSDLAGGRSTFPRRNFCVLNYSMYGDDKPYYAYPTAYSSTDIDLYDTERYVSYVIQKTTSYEETIGDKSVLLLHGFDRESYAVATWKRHITSIITSTGDTSGSLANFTCMPEEQARIRTVAGYITYSPTGSDVRIAAHADYNKPIPAIGGWDYEPSIVGKVVCITSQKSIGGIGTQTNPPINSLVRTLNVRVGETTKISTLDSDQLFRNYVDGDMFMFRACAAAWNKGRTVRSIEATSPLITDNLGGVAPGNSITTFIGVF